MPERFEALLPPDQVQPPEPIVITEDVASYLRDIETGAIASLPELQARLATRPGELVQRPNTFYGDILKDARGYPVRESRQVDKPAQAEIVFEAKARQEVADNKKQAEGFKSYLSDITDGTIDDAKELQARFATRPGELIQRPNSYYGDYLKDARGMPLRESRQVDQGQKDALKTGLEIAATASKTVAMVKDLASYSTDIAAGTIDDAKELKARFATRPGELIQRPNSYYGDYLKDARGMPLRESRSVGQQEQLLLLGDLQDATAVREAKKTAEDFASYKTEVLTGSIGSLNELRARFATRPGELVQRPNSRYGDYLTDARGNPLRESRQVDKDQQAALISLYQAVAKLGEYKDALVNGLVLDDDATRVIEQIIAKYQGSMTPVDAKTAAEQLEAATSVIKLWRRGEADKRITNTIVATSGNLQQVFPMIRDDAEEDLEDRRRAERLTALTYKARRVSFSSTILGQIAEDEPDIDGVLRQVTDFAESPDPTDRTRAGVLGQYAYRVELAQARQALLQALSNDGIEAYKTLEGGLKLRPNLGSFQYDAEVEDIKAAFKPVVQEVQEAQVSLDIADLVDAFGEKNTREIVETIQDITQATESPELGEQILAFYKRYLTNRRDKRPEDYRQMFSFEVEALRKSLLPDYEFDQGLGRNLAAAKTIARNFRDVVLPLFETLRGEPRYQQIARFVGRGVVDGQPIRNRFVQDKETLARQRPLTNQEAAYLDSVEALSAFNPYLVGLANVNPAVTAVYLEAFFKERSQRTAEELEDGAYVPLVQVGLGPNGLASLGEIMRSRPELAADMLVVDDAELPGGPFGIPKGPAWDLNSANSSGLDGFVLPDGCTDLQVGKRVRDYGSPLRWYPGERNKESSTRPGSINTTVDYLINPDVISNGRYPTNEDEALVLQLQTALLTNKLLLNNRVVQGSDLQDGSGRKEIILQSTQPDGTKRLKRIYTDELIVASGLGDVNYGFDLSTSKAKFVLQAQERVEGFPRFSDTLRAFQALASKEQDSPIPGKRIVVYGNGNSADTLIEYLGGLFDSNNPNVRNIEKIYVVTTGKLSQRPRYAQISDLRSRNGRGNLVEEVSARVGDVDFSDPEGPLDQPLKLFDTNGNIIQDNAGNEIVADNVIAATGFRSTTLSGNGPLALLTEERSADGKLATEPFSLPTNKNVSVGDRIKGREDLLLVGTGSNPGFDVTDKLLQLPPDARSALLRNGAENAVAIGFRAPDTQAAVRLFLDRIPKSPERVDRLVKQAPETVIIDASDEPVNEPVRFDISRMLGNLPPLRRDVLVDSEALTPLLLRGLNNLRLVHADQQQSYSMNVKFDGSELEIDAAGIPTSLRDRVVEAAMDNPYFLAYAAKAVQTRRDAQGLRIKLAFRNGRLFLRNSYVQAQ